MKKTIIGTILLGLLISNVWGQGFERYKKLADTSLVSTHLGIEKNISVTVPTEWQKDIDRSFPLIVVFDRQNARSHGYMLQTIDYLTSNEQMPASVIISIESAQAYRYRETLHKASDEQGLAKENEKFLFEELIPFAETHYKASAFRILIGHSRYGYFTSSVLFSRDYPLNGVIALSPFFDQANVSLVDSLATLQHPPLASRIYYRFGIGNDYPSDFIKMDAAIQKLNAPLFDAKGFFFPEADHNATPGLTIGVALYEIFEAWSKIQSQYIANTQKDLGVLQTLEAEIRSTYGTRLAFSLGILNGKGWYFYNEGQFEKAIEAWEIMLQAYPNFSEGHLYILDAQMQLKKKKTYADTIARFKASIAGSHFYSQEEKDELMQELETMLQ